MIGRNIPCHPAPHRSIVVLERANQIFIGDQREFLSELMNRDLVAEYSPTLKKLHFDFDTPRVSFAPDARSEQQRNLQKR